MLEGLDNTILLGFVEEAQSYTPTIRHGITAFQHDSSRAEEIQLAYRQVHTIKGAALMIGMAELSDLANSLETALEEFQSGGGHLSGDSAAYQLVQLERIESLLAEAADNFRVMDTEMSGAGFETDHFADFSFAEQEHQNSGANPASQNQFADTPQFDDEDIDPEMLEVFALEAEELLQNISANLQILEQNPHNGEALQSIRRSSHTLKGAAGVCGFKTTSQLAHRMEDLLDHLAEHPLDSTPQTTALLLASTDSLEKLSHGATAAQLGDQVTLLYSRYDELFAGVNRADSLSQFAAQQQTEQPTETEQTEVVAAAGVIMPEIAEMAEAADQTANMTGAAVQRTVVRVGLERLDEMVKLMGEMVISRTVLEQRHIDIETQLNEMKLSTNRLRKIAGKLEIDYEASALAGSQRNGSVAKGFVPAFLAAQNSFVPSAALENAAVVPTNGDKYGFDDLEFDRYTEFHQLTRELVETSTDTSSITADLEDLLSDLDSLLDRQRRLSDELQDKLMRLRMVPLGTLATRLYRTVRVTADSEGKQVDMEIEGEDVEIDSQVLSSLAEPLLHLLKNCVVHGIEPSDARQIIEKPLRGMIRLRAFHEGTNIVLSITDDGRGMNPNKLRNKAVAEYFVTAEEAAAMSDEQALQLVFLPGFSTAAKINENAGRGVGMDIVRDAVVRQQGSVSIKSTTGRGTTIQVRLPMSMAVTRSLVVNVYGQRFAIPLNSILQLAQVSGEDFDHLTQEKILWVGGKFYPVQSLNDLLGLPAMADRDESRITTLLVQAGEQTIALTIDEIVEAREIVIKPATGLMSGKRGLLGATIFGDGSVVPILDLAALLTREADFLAKSKDQTPKAATTIKAAPTVRAAQLRVMIVDDSPSVRRVMSNFITKAGWQATVAKDGLEAVEILQISRDLPDVILSDVEMPRMDGYELIATLKRLENLSEIPIVMITSRAGEKHRQKALEIGASDYVTKPYQDSVLLETIKRLAQTV